MDLLTNPMVTGGLAIGVMTGIVYSLKGAGKKLMDKIKNRFVSKIIVYDYDELFYVLEEWLGENYPAKCRSMEAAFQNGYSFETEAPRQSSSNRKLRQVIYKQDSNIFFIKYKGKQLLFSKDKKELTNAQYARALLNFHYAISTWNNKQILIDFIEEITAEYNRRLLGTKLSVYTSEYDGNWRIVTKKNVKPIDKVILPEQVKLDLLKDLDQFISRREWYSELSMTYKRSYLLYGPPGTGKTTTAQSIAAYLNKDVCLLNLNSIISDSALVDTFARIPDNSLLLIEDIDCVFRGREAVSNNIKITFSTLINCLDGAISKDGVVTVITTNHIEHLDPALIREGRMDNKFLIPLATSKEIHKYMSLFYGKDIYVEEGVQLNMSAVQGICMSNEHNPKAAVEIIMQKTAYEVAY